MIQKIKIVFKQIRYMYNDARVEKWCDEGEKINDEIELKKYLVKMSRKFENPEMQRIAFLIMGNKWEDVFFPGFIETLDATDQALLK